MPWWSWVLIWTGAVLVHIGVLAAVVWWLFKKATATYSELAGALDVLDDAREAIEARITPYEPKRNAISRGAIAVAEEREAIRADIDERKAVRREARLARGKRLIKADPMQYAFLARK